MIWRINGDNTTEKLFMELLKKALKQTESFCREIPYFPAVLHSVFTEEHPHTEEFLPFLLLLPQYAKGEFTEKALRLAAAFQLIHLSRLVHKGIQAEDKPDNRAIVLEGDLLSAAAYQILVEHGSDQILEDTANIMAEASESWFLGRDFMETEQQYRQYFIKNYGQLCRFAAEIGAEEANWPQNQINVFGDMAENIGYIYTILKGKLGKPWKEYAAKVKETAITLHMEEEIECMLTAFNK